MSFDQKTIENRLLAALPVTEYQNLAPHLKLVPLTRGQILYQAGESVEYVYFPNRAVVSLVNTLQDGSTVEVGLVGKEGLVGTPAFLGGNTASNTASVQIPDAAMQIKASILKAEFNRGGQLQSLLLRYVQALYIHVAQSVACNRFHTVDERLARWLLVVSDALESDQLPLTQEFIAQMLGTRRAGVTVAAGILNKAGMIQYRRGNISIINREELEATSCECYSVIKNEYNRLLNNTW